MNGKSRTGTGYAVAHADVGDAITHGEHNSGAAVTNRLRLGEAGAHSLQRGGQAIPFHLGQHVAHEVRTSLCLRQQTLACKFRGRALSACRNQGRRHANQHTAGQQFGSRNFSDRQVTRPRVL